MSDPTELTALLGTAPEDPDVIATMGDVLANSGRLDTAVVAYERALAVDPTHRHALRRRAAVVGVARHDTASVEGYWGIVAERPGDAAATQGLRQAVLGRMRRLRVLLGTVAVGTLVVSADWTESSPDPSGSDVAAGSLVIRLIGWAIVMAAAVSTVVVVRRSLRHNRTALMRVARGWPLLLVVLAVPAGSALLVVAVATSALLGVVTVAPPWSWPWPGLAAFTLVMVASVLSVALHWQASPPPRAARKHTHRSAARSEADPGGPR
ncbi:hypothetical protein E9228_000049 [Curtobacterium flaccumfaciens]|uniref:Tetratricopeptide repeat protein n=1 Tax=Curtobacterium salicis TaxID=1779862 RepID=A0ABX0T1R2_9MICO|nr:tetratricopeptide repeat protein [Curtobacterium sp. WW7]NII39430.1 hypothetical protein [Curtobacterium sp. WW7]